MVEKTKRILVPIGFSEQSLRAFDQAIIVAKLIEADLTQAETDLPDKGVQEGRPNKWSAKTLLADAYLTTEQWQKAANKADEVIKSGKFSLVEVKVSDDFLKILDKKVNQNLKLLKYFPFLNYKNRELILKNLKFVNKVIPQNTLDYTDNLIKIRLGRVKNKMAGVQIKPNVCGLFKPE